jgi:hypothetical protein
MTNALLEVLPEIRGLLEAGRISVSDFHYQKYNGCEVIP